MPLKDYERKHLNYHYFYYQIPYSIKDTHKELLKAEQHCPDVLSVLKYVHTCSFSFFLLKVYIYLYICLRKDISSRNGKNTDLEYMVGW